MRIWIYLNGMQQGPYTPEEIAAMNLAPSTPVWYEGLSQWLPASEAPVTATMVGNTVEQPETIKPAFSDRPGDNGPQNHVHSADLPPCPPTYMAWAIFVTICCCLPGGIVAIIFSSLTSGAYNRGDYNKAVKMSEYAQWAIILSIVFGFLSLPIAMLF